MTLKTLFAAAAVIALASPAFADQPESLVNDPSNLVTGQPREQVLIMQAHPGNARAPIAAPRDQKNETGFDHAKGDVPW